MTPSDLRDAAEKKAWGKLREESRAALELGASFPSERMIFAWWHAKAISLQAEKDALEGALREICEHAPEAEDFEVGGKFDYDNSCGNSDDVEYLGEAREHFRLAKIAEAALKGDKKL